MFHCMKLCLPVHEAVCSCVVYRHNETVGKQSCVERRGVFVTIGHKAYFRLYIKTLFIVNRPTTSFSNRFSRSVGEVKAGSLKPLAREKIFSCNNFTAPRAMLVIGSD